MNDLPAQISPRFFLISLASFKFFFDLEFHFWAVMTLPINQRHDAWFPEAWKTQSFEHAVMQMSGEKREKSVTVYHNLAISWQPSLLFASTSSHYVQRVRKCRRTQCSTKGEILNEPRIFPSCFSPFQFNPKPMVFDMIPEIDTHCLLETYLLKEPENVWKVGVGF